MTCTFDPWMKELFASFGTAGAFIFLGVTLMFWGGKKVRREHYPNKTWREALLLNWPAFLYMGLGAFVILFTMVASLFIGGK